MKQPLVDTNSILAIETLFRGYPIDPWAKLILREFTDLYVYSDAFRFTLPLPDPRDADSSKQPMLVNELCRLDTQVPKSEIYSTSEPRCLDNKYLEECFFQFSNWATANSNDLKRWLKTHYLPWVRNLHIAQIVRPYVFDLDKLIDDPRLKSISHRLRVDPEKICYAFDNVLRFPIYGEMTGSDEYYLHHPVRDAFPMPTARFEHGVPPCIPVSWGTSAARLAEHMTLVEFAEFLYELRCQIREYRLHLLGPRQVDRETVREIASKVRLPARVTGIGRAAVAIGGILAALTTIPVLGPFATIAGAAISISAAIWQGRLPISVSARIKWLQWVKWDEEAQIDRNR